MKKFFILFLAPYFLLAWNLYPTYPNYLAKKKELLEYFYFKAKTPQKVVALTFDDGPNRHTKAIMEVLKKYNAPATFFLIGKNLKKDSYKLYQNPLFSVGMHTFDHKQFDKVSSAVVDEDFQKTIALFKKRHLQTTLFRPAYGVVNQAIVNNLQKYNIHAILWSNDSFDWDKKRRSYKNVVEHLESGDIILMHDHATKPQELAQLLEAIAQKGFRVVSINELLKYPSALPFN